MNKTMIAVLFLLAGCGSTSTPSETRAPSEGQHQTAQAATETVQVGGVTVQVNADQSQAQADSVQQDEQSQADSEAPEEPQEMRHVRCYAGSTVIYDEIVPADNYDMGDGIVKVTDARGKTHRFIGTCEVSDQ